MLMRKRQGGFTLIELMVSLVLALVVMSAVITLVVAVIRSNRQTLQSTRLNQELRSTLNLVANDLRRARSMADPITAALGTNDFREVRTPGNVCAIYAYDDALAGPWHTIALNNGRLMMVGANARPNACATGGNQLNSDQVEVTALRFDRVPAGAPDDFVRQIDVTITGRLVNANASAPPVERTMRQTVYVRSVGTGI